MSGTGARREGTRSPRAAVIALAASLLVAAAALPAAADWKAFLPRSLERHAYLDFFGSYERDHVSTDFGGFEWTDQYLRERLTLETFGYSYHPRFLRYQLSLSGAATQEDYQHSSLDGGGWNLGGGFEYDARVSVLPEHPYNLYLFASRREPVFKQQAATQHSSVADTYGATFRLQRSPYALGASFIDTSLDSEFTDSDVQRVSLDGEYLERFASGIEVSLHGAFDPSWYQDSRGLDGMSLESLVDTEVSYEWARLSSSVSQNSFDQDREGFESYDTDQFTWYELLTLDLPWELRSDLSFRRHDDETRVSQDGLPDRIYLDEGDNVQAELSHRLYESLDSRYSLIYDTRESTGGEVNVFANLFGLDYTKRIPRGRFLAGISVGRVDTDNSGFADIANEPYNGVAVPGTVTLRQINIDPESLAVFLHSPLPPFETILLTENVHYIVGTLVEPLEIQILALPPEFVVPGSYDFFVSYSLFGGDYEIRTDTVGSIVSLNLFEDLVTPYVSWTTVRSDLLSGEYPGTPIDSDTYGAGLLLHRGPWRLRGEYQKLDWEVSPYWLWRTELQYVGTLTDTMRLYGTARYQQRHYQGAEIGTYRDPFTEETASVSANVQKQLPPRNLFVSLGGTYSRLDGLVTTNSYAANSSLVWTRGALDVTVGVSAYGADTSGSESLQTEHDHELVYINVRRQLF